MTRSDCHALVGTVARSPSAAPAIPPSRHRRRRTSTVSRPASTGSRIDGSTASPRSSASFSARRRATSPETSRCGRARTARTSATFAIEGHAQCASPCPNPSTISLDRLHRGIQIAMGWENCHLWEFEIDGSTYGDSTGHPSADPNLKDACKRRLGVVAPAKGARFKYTYDFGDGWIHEIEV